MYDAKSKEEDEDDEMRCNCISETGYFIDVSQERIGKLKTCYVPQENIFE